MTKYTLLAIPRQREFFLIMGRWAFPRPGVICILHGNADGETWFTKGFGKTVSVYYNNCADGFEIGWNGKPGASEIIGYIDHNNIAGGTVKWR